MTRRVVLSEGYDPIVVEMDGYPRLTFGKGTRQVDFSLTDREARGLRDALCEWYGIPRCNDAPSCKHEMHEACLTWAPEVNR